MSRTLLTLPRRWTSVLFLLAGAACSGEIAGRHVPPAPSDPSSMGGSRSPGRPTQPGGAPAPADHPNAPLVPPVMGPPAPPPRAAALTFGKSGMRRLTQVELKQTIQDLLGLDPGGDIELLPVDDRTPFDNDYGTQVASRALVEAAGTIARGLATRVTTDPALRARLVGCTPSGPGDGACFKQFVTRFGRRALRRPLTPAEVDRYAALQTFSTKQQDFFAGVGLVLRAMLQDLEFLYLTSIGTPVQGSTDMVKLGGYEIASRLSYLLWGSMPDDALFDTADKGQLETPDGVKTAATRLLSDVRAKARVARFHALWLGYEQPAVPTDLRAPMLAETDALVDKVIFGEPGSWLRLFTATETYVDKRLASHYGLPSPAKGKGWVTYPADSGRQGILSHGAFLANGSKGSDTSPTMRGIHIRKALFCQEIPPPPPDQNVNVDEPPKAAANGSLCKKDRYAEHGSGGCANCHKFIDPIGFGLENYDATGRYRTVEPGAPTCSIDGTGEVDGVGTFRGPKQLADLLVETEHLDHCLATQVYRFTLGRKDRPDDADAIAALTQKFRAGEHRFDRLLIELVSTPAFGYRSVE